MSDYPPFPASSLLSANSKIMAKLHLTLISRVVDLYGLKQVAERLNKLTPGKWCRRRIVHSLKAGMSPDLLSRTEELLLNTMLPAMPVEAVNPGFHFIDLFAGIGGIRKGFEGIGGRCVFTSEWDAEALKTYQANWYNDPVNHKFNRDIRDVTLSSVSGISEEQVYCHIDECVPDHHLLLAGFPCQPFSVAGVSKKNALGKKHGFECETQGTLFFDVARILAAKKPAIFVLENVKNLKRHDHGKTFRIIMQTLDELGYAVANADDKGPADPKILDGSHFLPQHRERIVLVGFRRDLRLHANFDLKDITHFYPVQRHSLTDLLDAQVDEKYILTPKLWQYLYNYAKKHKIKGNGFGYGLVDPTNKNSITRTLSARYYKDGSEILIDRGWDFSLGEKGFHDAVNLSRRPRRLTPRECARLMGFEQPGAQSFNIPVSDTQSYRQFGNSVVVPLFSALAYLLKPYIERAVILTHER